MLLIKSKKIYSKRKVIFMKWLYVFVFFLFFNIAYPVEKGVYIVSPLESGEIEVYLKKIKDSGFNTIILTFTDEDVEDGKSVAYFHSNLLPMAEGVPQDYIEQVIETAHSLGIKVYAFFNLPDEHFLSIHPEWISILSNGKPSDYYNSNDYFQRLIPPSRILNSPEYLNLLSGIISEICTFNIDGFDLNDNFQWAEWYLESEDKTLTSSFDSFTIARFSEETGISVEGNSPEEYAEFILNNNEVYSRWVEWRAEKVNLLLSFIKKEIKKSGKFIPFRPHLLASKWAKEDYGIDYREVCRIADVPYTMILVDENEENLKKYRELTSLITGVSSKKLAVSTYLYNVEEGESKSLADRIYLLSRCNAKSINLFDLELIREKNLFETVKLALKDFDRRVYSKKSGFRMGVNIFGAESMSKEEIEKSMANAKSLGVRYVRVPVIWEFLNPEKGRFDFDYCDRVVEKAIKYNVSPLLTIAFTPKWISENRDASDYYLYPPAAGVLGDYQSPFGTGTGYDYLYLFAKTIAERYRGEVEYFELWNEEDIPSLFKITNQQRAKTYSKMLFYFFNGIKDGNPDARVLMGGLALSTENGSETDFLQKILNDSDYPAGENFDIANIHTNFKSIEDIEEAIKKTCLTMEQSGVKKPLWITETSYSPDINYQFTPFDKGNHGFLNYIQSCIKEQLSLTDGAVFWAPLSDLMDNENAFKFNGLFNSKGKIKESGLVFKNIAESKDFEAIIPHIAENNWETEVKISNLSGEVCFATLYTYSNGTLKSRINLSIPPLSSKTLTNSDFEFNGFAILKSNSNTLSITLSYRYKDTRSLSSFSIESLKGVKWVIPLKKIDWFDWTGIALANHYNESIKLTLNFYKSGNLIKRVDTNLNGKTKLVGTIEDIAGTGMENADFLIIDSEREISPPILITGNNEQDRHAFFKAIPFQFEGGKYYVNHIAESNWETEVEIINPESNEAVGQIYLYGGNNVSKSVVIPPYSKKILKAGEDFDYGTLLTIQSDTPIIAIVYYRYKEKKSICAFPILKNNVSKNIIVKNKFSNWFDWSGLAFANFLPLKVKVDLLAEKDGKKKGEAAIEIEPYSKVVDTVENLIPGVNPEDFDTIKIKCDYPIPMPILISGNNEQDRHTFFGGEKLNAKQYPLIANYFLDYILNQNDAIQLAKRNLIVIDMEHGENNKSNLSLIKSINPEIKMLAYMTTEEIETESEEGSLREKLFSGIKDEWWLLNCNGEHIVFWPYTWMLNCSDQCPEIDGERWNTYFADFVASDVLSVNLWDGFYLDNCWDSISWADNCIDINRDGRGDNPDEADLSWFNGMSEMIERIKCLCPDSLLMGNGGYSYPDKLNGALIEEFTMWNPWYNELKTLQKLELTTQKPSLNVLNGCGSERDYPFFRYSFASSLCFGGYFVYDYGSDDHSQHWYYDEYDVNLGVPLKNGRIVVENPVLENNFENSNWQINNIASIYENGIEGKSLIADSTNSSEEWNDYLFSPAGNIEPESEVIIRFKYRIIYRESNTGFYITIRSASQPENFDITRDLYFGENTPVGMTDEIESSFKLEDVNDYQIVFGIRNRGKILIDSIEVFSDSNTMYSIREFENGIAIANNSKKSLTLNLNGDYRRIKGVQDPETNNGERVYSITIPPKDGIILVKEDAQ